MFKQAIQMIKQTVSNWLIYDLDENNQCNSSFMGVH